MASVEQKEIIQLLRDHFPVLAFSTDVLTEIAEHARRLQLPTGQVLIETGATIQYIPLVLNGAIKVVRTDDEQHEMLLYYIQPGESCAFTLSSSLKREKSKIKAIVQQPSTVLVIPSEFNGQLARRYPLWFEFVLDAYSKRMEELLELVEEIGFKHLDHRLEKYLKEKFILMKTPLLTLSHQEIADDLGTARVVVSRMLKQLEKKGVIQLMRGKIKNISLV